MDPALGKEDVRWCVCASPDSHLCGPGQFTFGDALLKVLQATKMGRLESCPASTAKAKGAGSKEQWVSSLTLSWWLSACSLA